MKRNDDRLPIDCVECQRATHARIVDLARRPHLYRMPQANRGDSGIRRNHSGEQRMTIDNTLSFAEFEQWAHAARAETEAAIAAAGDVANAERAPHDARA